MFILFFIIVFIAELIVAGKIISVITACDRQVICVNNQVDNIKPVISNGVQTAKNGVKSLTKGLGLFAKFMDKKKNDAIRVCAKMVLSVLIVLLLKKIPDKKVLTLVDIMFVMANLLKRQTT